MNPIINIISIIVTFLSLFIISYFSVKYFQWSAIIVYIVLFILCVLVNIINNTNFNQNKEKNMFDLMHYHNKEDEVIQNKFLLKKEIISRVYSYFTSLLILSILIKLVLF